MMVQSNKSPLILQTSHIFIFLMNYNFGFNSESLMTKGQNWHAGIAHGFAGFGLRATVFLGGKIKKKNHCLMFATVQPHQLNCPGMEGKRSKMAATLYPSWTWACFWLMSSCGENEMDEMGLGLAEHYSQNVKSTSSQNWAPPRQTSFCFVFFTWLAFFEPMEVRWDEEKWTTCLYR